MTMLRPITVLNTNQSMGDTLVVHPELPDVI